MTTKRRDGSSNNVWPSCGIACCRTWMTSSFVSKGNWTTQWKCIRGFLIYIGKPLAQGALVLQTASGLRDRLQESSLVPAMFFYPFLAILFWSWSETECLAGLTFTLTQYVCYYVLIICFKLHPSFLIFTNYKTVFTS